MTAGGQNKNPKEVGASLGLTLNQIHDYDKIYSQELQGVCEAVPKNTSGTGRGLLVLWGKATSSWQLCEKCRHQGGSLLDPYLPVALFMLP
ncbi:hypothetical protein [Ectobacillus antri]|uniref:hypothetical protein n=1 Tax=Ectobacillus antri TaxID=2486280 RepID=UPI0013DDCED1|nr:hypothetical protein [Ectobacillus antri]